MQDTEHAGFWWLPATPDNKVAGTLSFSNDEGIALRLIGALRDFGSFNTSQSMPLILGVSEEGKTITVANCTVTNMGFSAPGFGQETYTAEYYLVGVHFEKTEDVTFTRFAVSYTYLADWSRTAGFTIKKYNEEPKLEVSYSLPTDLTAKTSHGNVCLSFNCRTQGDGIQEISLRQSVHLEVEPDKGRPFLALNKEYIFPLQNLLTLATTKPNAVTELKVFSPQVFIESDGKRIETPIQLFYRQKFFEARTGKLLIPDYMLFTVHDVSDNFENIFERWFTVSKELDSVCNLFFGAEYSQGMYLENTFLNVVHSIESYHRRRMTNHVRPKAEHRKFIRDILANVDSKHSDWLRQQLAYSNEPRLEGRIMELLDKAAGVLEPLITNKQEFAKKVKDTRNYLTHFDRRLSEKRAQGTELFWLTQKLSYVLKGCLLLELGLSSDKCKQLIHRNQSFIFASSHAAS
jgi:ApeA N-terminal domain 1